MSVVNRTSASACGGARQRKEKDHCTFNTVALFFALSSHLIFFIQFAVKQQAAVVAPRREKGAGHSHPCPNLGKVVAKFRRSV